MEFDFAVCGEQDANQTYWTHLYNVCCKIKKLTENAAEILNKYDSCCAKQLMMIKNCARCDKEFECRNDDISKCSCFTVPLSFEDLAFISESYTGCLCIACLNDMRLERSEKSRQTFTRELK